MTDRVRAKRNAILCYWETQK